MTPIAVLRSFTRPPWPGLLAVTAGGSILYFIGASHAVLPAICGVVVGATSPSDWMAAMKATFAFNPVPQMVGEWALMLLSMMPPLLAMPLMHVWRASRPAKRVQLVAVFLLGYGGVWMMAGLVLVISALLMRLVLGQGALVGVVILALLWNSSPGQQMALNRGHRLRRIGLFGWRAHRDGLVFGATHGMWCIASCWAWMLVPLAAGDWHVPLMLLSGVMMLLERLSLPGPARWRWPTTAAWLRLLTNQAIMRLAQPRNG